MSDAASPEAPDRSTADAAGGLAPRERAALLDLAHRAIAAAAAGQPADATPLPDMPAGSALAAPRGAFVSLYAGDDLRGCIGTFDTSRDLARTVREMAAAAALHDPRFEPVTPAEAGGLHVEISALTPRRRVHAPEEIEVGRHGIEVSRAGRRGVLLPQVAQEHGLSREGFLAATCRKAGLPAEAWREPDVELAVFEAEVFGDEIDGSGSRS